MSHITQPGMLGSNCTAIKIGIIRTRLLQDKLATIKLKETLQGGSA